MVQSCKVVAVKHQRFPALLKRDEGEEPPEVLIPVQQEDHQGLRYERDGGEGGRH